MRRLLLSAAAFAAVMSLMATYASAAVPERSGNIFHIAACPGPAVPGTARCHAHIVTDRSGNVIAHTVQPSAPPPGYGPADLRRAYKIQNTESQAIIAVVVAYGYANAQQDLAVYRAKFHLPPCTTTAACFIKFDQIGQPLNYPPEDLGWSQESALDLDMASAICPSCKIYLIEADTSRFSDLAQAENTAARLGAHAISNSYGGPESGTGSMESAYNHLGIAITASSGDSGGGVQFPASSPHVTAVGGTHLVRDASARGWNETGWGNGGGCSSVYAKPTWQTDPLCTMRTVSDVAAVADPATGVAVYGPVTTGHPAWLVFGGTSVAAPIIAGVYAANGRPVKYGSDPYVPTGHLFDIVTGPAGSCGTYLCTTGPGYDGPTGLGTPNGVAAF